MCLLCAQIIFFWGLPPIILVIHGLLWTLTKIKDMWLLSGNCLGTCVTAAFSREKNKKEMFHIVTDVCRFHKNTTMYVHAIRAEGRPANMGVPVVILICPFWLR